LKLKSLNKLNVICERLVYESRWLLYIFTIGLVLALVMYMIHFSVDTFTFVMHAVNSPMEDVMVSLLGLVDSYMVATLLIMIVKGSYQIFIHRFDHEPDPKPQWLDHIDTGLLKVKTAQSIASITGVALLKDFVNIERLGWELVVHRLQRLQ
jgi:uncharacterized protein (TIGR00645 family)